jgi:DNA-binding response OmpR family regulator
MVLASMHRAGMRRLSLIVAEDDFFLREWLVTVLAGIDAAVRQAFNGVDILALLAEGTEVDLVISDNRMPGMSGLEALVRARAAGIAVPFLLITGFGAADTRSAAEELGATVLEKPISVRELLSRVRALCGPSEAPESRDTDTTPDGARQDER